MDEIILQQKNAAKAMTGRRFVLGVAGIVMNLALAQIVVNLLISVTGTGLLNLLFYAYDPDTSPVKYQGVLKLNLAAGAAPITINVDLNQ